MMEINNFMIERRKDEREASFGGLSHPRVTGNCQSSISILN